MALKKKYIILFESILVGGLLFLINITLSKDIRNYEVFFEISQMSSWAELQIASSEMSVELFYLFLNKLWFADHYSLIAVLTFVAIWTKFIFFDFISKLYKINKWYLISSYIAFLGLVNDAAQLRVAVATGFVLLAVKFHIEKKFMKHIALLVISVLFHSSLIVVVLFYHFYRLFNKFFNPLIYVLIFIAAKLFLLDLIGYAIVYASQESRYAYYFDIDAAPQGSTGLFQYFFVGLIVIVFVHQWAISRNTAKARSISNANNSSYFFDFVNISGYIAIYMMLMFSQSVAVATRLSELFLMFFLIGLIDITRKNLRSRLIFNFAFMIAIILIGLARFYHTHIYLNSIFD